MLTQKFIQFLTYFKPEYSSKIGIRNADPYISSYTESQFELSQYYLDQLIQLAKKSDKIESDSFFLMYTQTEYKLNQLSHEYKVPYINIFYLLYQGIKYLPEHSVHIRTRLRAYAGYDNHIPITVQLQEWIRTRFDLQFPFYKEITKDIQSSSTYLHYIASKCNSYPEWNVLSNQLHQFINFLVHVYKPHTISTIIIPIPMYQHILLRYGVHTPIKTLLHDAYCDIRIIKKEMQQLVNVISKRNKCKPYYKDVLQFIQTKLIPSTKLLSTFQQRLVDIEHILITHHIIKVPDTPCVIRLATPEEDVIPIPRYERPVIFNSTSRGEFIIPSSITSEHNTEAGSWTLLAHETRPGHELHINKFQDHSIIEKICGWKSAYTEGWAMYAEYIMYPYIPIEAKFISLKMRWLRVARTILDITLHLGQITIPQATQYLLNTIRLSESMTHTEIDRMTFLSPGQSVSYYEGFRMILTKRKLYFSIFPNASLYDFHEWFLELSPDQWI